MTGPSNSSGNVQLTICIIVFISLTHTSPVLRPSVEVLRHSPNSIRRGLSLAAEEGLVLTMSAEINGELVRIVRMVRAERSSCG